MAKSDLRQSGIVGSVATPATGDPVDGLGASRERLRRALSGDAEPQDRQGAISHQAGSAREDRAGAFPRSRTMRALLDPRYRAVSALLISGGAMLAVRALPHSRIASLFTAVAAVNRVLHLNRR